MATFELWFLSTRNTVGLRQRVLDEIFTWPDSQLEEAPGAFRWQYSNPDTGVSFQVIIAKTPDETSEAENLPYGYFETEIRFRVAAPRAHFFALEAMSFVAHFAATFDLFVWDPQRPEAYPSRPDVTDLVESWAAFNHERLGQIRDAGDEMPPTFPAQASELWWNYQVHRRLIEQQAGEQVDAPSVTLLRDRRTGHMYRVASWIQVPTGVEPHRFVVPPCDLVLVIDASGSGADADLETYGVVTFEKFREVLAKVFEPMPSVIGTLDTVPGSGRAGAHRILHRQQRRRFDGADYERVPSHRFIDSEALNTSMSGGLLADPFAGSARRRRRRSR